MTLANLAHLARPCTGGAAVTWDEYRALIDTAVDNQPRTLQERIGPSELGTSCDRCLILKLAGIPEPRTPGASWLPYIGTAVHAALADMFTAANAGLPHARYLVETTVDVGQVGGEAITGHADLYDVETGDVTDWKVCGVTTLRRVRAKGPSTTYRVQAHLYGRGFTRRGLPVTNVQIAYLPRNAATLDAAHIWHEPYNEDIAVAALNRADMFTAGITVHGAPALLNMVQHTGAEYSCARYEPALKAGSADALRQLNGLLTPTPDAASDAGLTATSGGRRKKTGR